MLIPMRPGVTLYSAAHLPGGWNYQPKLDDERGMLRIGDGALYNRHGAPLARNKALHFRGVCEELRNLFPAAKWLDLGLIGFRDIRAFGAARGAVIVFDVPSADSWLERYALLAVLPVLDLVAGEVPVAGRAYRLANSWQGAELFEATRNVRGLEGVIGRRIDAPYLSGESQAMIRLRWLRG